MDAVFAFKFEADSTLRREHDSAAGAQYRLGSGELTVKATYPDVPITGTASETVDIFFCGITPSFEEVCKLAKDDLDAQIARVVAFKLAS